MFARELQPHQVCSDGFAELLGGHADDGFHHRDPPSAATWNAWLVSGNTTQLLWTQSQPITEPQITVTKTTNVPASRTVGVLSTLTSASRGIACSSWNLVNTGTP